MHSVKIFESFPTILQKFRQINFFSFKIFTLYQFDEKKFKWGNYLKSGASRAPKVRGGQKPNFAPTFQKSRVLLHFYVTIFLDSQSQGGPRPPWTLWIRDPCLKFTVWKLRKFSHTLFWQKYRENNDFTKEVTKYLVDLTKYFFGKSKFRVFPHCEITTLCLLK